MTADPTTTPTATPAASLTDELVSELGTTLAAADEELARRFPGDRGGRQPVHTVYVPADVFHADLVPEWGERALATLAEHEQLLIDLLDDGSDGIDGSDAVLARVRAKLAAEPVEDLRVDFEDGYGDRGDEAEDRDVAAAARALAEARSSSRTGGFAGIRMKSLEAPTRERGVRTLVGFAASYAEAGGRLAELVVTLPKVTSVDQVRAMVTACERVERLVGADANALRFEIQVETPQAIVGPDGTALVAPMLHASEGRCSGLHYGTYDYSAFCGIAAAYQSMDHPVADFAKAVMQAAAAGTGVRLSDGSTNLLPVGDAAAVSRGWAEHTRLVRRSLERGYYQGWDLHPAQLPSRFAATYAFYRDGATTATGRLDRYLSRTPGAVLDEPATARALADFVLRGRECGALDPADLPAGVDDPALLALARPGR